MTQPTRDTALRLPRVQPVEYANNFVRLAVCELRFPTLLEYETKVPADLQKALRKEYPHFDKTQSVNLSPTKVEGETRYIFQSKQKDYTVAFRPSAISLEVSKYRSFAEFRAKLTHLLASARRTLDTDFLTRIGLRYLNHLPTGTDGRGWINPELVKPLEEGTFGAVSRYWQEIRGNAPTGNYTFRHGYPGATENERPEYILDIDMSVEDVDIDETIGQVDALHAQSFAFFHWSLGPRALEALGKATPKEP